MPVNDQDREAFNALLADPVHGRLIARMIDSRVSEAVKTHAQKHPDGASLLARVESIREHFEAKLKAAELRAKTVEIAFQKGVPMEMIDGLKLQFESEEDINERLDVLKSTLEQQDTIARNKLVTEGSYMPGSGRGESRDISRDALSNMNRNEILWLEQSGALDRALRGAK